MQSYSIAKVGGLLSGNAHERYRGEGPLIRSVLASDFILGPVDVWLRQRHPGRSFSTRD
jgi:hypothetical protein